MISHPPVKIGFLPAHRGFFSAKLAAEMRARTLQALCDAGFEVVVPSVEQTPLGCVESLQDAEFAAELFRSARVEGILVGAMNFGDEQGVALAVKTLGKKVPILLFGCPEDGPLQTGSPRRDSFCGLLSIADALRQIDVPYSLPECPILHPGGVEFANELQVFAGICRVHKTISSARYGQIGARPDAFWTCRYDERSLQRFGPTTVTCDLSEILASVSAMDADNSEVHRISGEQQACASMDSVDGPAKSKLAKLELALERFVNEKQLHAVAIQCWTSLQKNLGVCSCLAMSRLADRGIPAACEADIPGAISMHALQLAGGMPAALADWNNLHPEDPDLVNLWHCGVFPISLAAEKPVVRNHEILSEIAGVVAPEDAQGVVEMELRPGAVTLFRIAPDPHSPVGWQALVAQGNIENRPENSTRGSGGWCRIPGLLSLYRDTLLRHFPHHVALAPGNCGKILAEVFGRYFQMKVHTHNL